MTVKEVCETVKIPSDEVMFVTERSALPVLEIVKVCVPEVFTWMSPKARLATDSVKAGAVPVPLTETDAGLPVALCVIVTVADLLPDAVGANVTVIVWLWPPAMVAEVGLTVNAASLDEIALIVRADCPAFVIVNVCVPVCPTPTLPKLMVVGLMATDGGWAVPLPLRATEEGLPDAL